MAKVRELSHTRKIDGREYKQVEWHHALSNAKAYIGRWRKDYPDNSFRILPASSSSPKQYGRRGYGIFISSTKNKRKRTR